jgi:hypothetical protein
VTVRGLAGVVVVAVAACSAGAPGPGIDAARAADHAAALVALGPRPGDSPAARSAASYVDTQLAAMGVHAERMAVGTVEVPARDVPGVIHRAARTRETHDPDLVVRFGPPGRALLIMAHYDSVPDSPGAIDNAAAVGVVLELARVLALAPPPQPVMLVFTANEEIGLIGAEALAARHGDDVRFAVALDLVGGRGALSLNGASRLIGSAELAWIAGAAARAGVVVSAPLPHRVISRWWPEIERSDHGPFTRRGIPAVHLYHRGQDGESIDLAYHSARDTAARIDRRSLDEIGRLLRALVAVPPPAHDGDGLWLPLAIDTVVPRWPLIALDAALAALALGLLTAMRMPRARGGFGLAAGAVCFALAAGATAAFERLAAGAHPMPWLHAPATWILAELAVFVGGFGLATRGANRIRPWIGARRYLAIAIAAPLAVGLGWLLLGAAELAWIWLVSAAACAVAPRIGRFGLAAIALSVLPGVLVLSPDLLREAAWNGFLPDGLPLAAWLAAFLASPLAAVAWWLRKAPTLGPLGTLVLPVGSGLAIAAGVVVVLHAHPPCNPMEFRAFHLACEVTRGVR